MKKPWPQCTEVSEKRRRRRNTKKTRTGIGQRERYRDKLMRVAVMRPKPCKIHYAT